MSGASADNFHRLVMCTQRIQKHQRSAEYTESVCTARYVKLRHAPHSWSHCTTQIAEENINLHKSVTEHKYARSDKCPQTEYVINSVPACAGAVSPRQSHRRDALIKIAHRPLMGNFMGHTRTHLNEYSISI